MKHFVIAFDHKDQRKEYKIKGKSQIFGGLEEMLHYYENNENNEIDPALNRIGRHVTEQESPNRCTIL